jgi:hypothetical protein
MKLAREIPLQICIQELLGKDIGQDADSPEGFHSFIKSLHENRTGVFQLGHDRCLQHPLQFIIHYHPVIRHCMDSATHSIDKETTD